MTTKFTPGQAVRMTADAIRQGLQGPKDRRTGRVVEVYRLAPEYIRVRRDGLKSTERWSITFWEAI